MVQINGCLVSAPAASYQPRVAPPGWQQSLFPVPEQAKKGDNAGTICGAKIKVPGPFVQAHKTVPG
eukprot:1160811-Pelagomonas_calceolata.AAC.7